MQQQPPIADYGLIGDMRTAALVSRYGRIDWCCLPRFDSGSLFAAILDPERGGNWSIQPVDDGFTARQQYREGTNILETVFRTEGAFSICTFWLAEALLRCGDRQANGSSAACSTGPTTSGSTPRRSTRLLASSWAISPRALPTSP
ncbi:MAG TPA: trehalase-like domain-containing protein [Gemmatimonadales bacterium]|nr:trehalase-like domain-containing protein [Gemmatimonadales bacterium]